MLVQTTIITLLTAMASTATACNPMTDPICLVTNPALSTDLSGYSSKHYRTSGNVEVLSPFHLDMSLRQRFDNPMIESKFSILYGRVECEIQAAGGTGIISSFYLQSDDLDEIDIAEIFGGNPYEFQSNFFIKGNTSTWDRGGYHAVPNPLQTFNRYAVEWTPSRISWFVNGYTYRVLDATNPYGIPSSPMQVKLSLWAGGDPSNPSGTILWAGGVSDYVGMPYTMRVRNLQVTDYSTGTFYTYGFRENKWESPSSVAGEIGGRVGGYNIEASAYLQPEMGYESDSVYQGHESDPVIQGHESDPVIQGHEADPVESGLGERLVDGLGPFSWMFTVFVFEVVFVLVWM